MKTMIKLEKHNEETYNAIKEAFVKRNHIGVVQATGTGKSYIIAKTIEDNDLKNVLFLSPSLHIINQFKETFKNLESRITFATYKKLSYIDDLKDFLHVNDFGAIILDEYHRCGAKTWGTSVKEILSESKDKKVLGVTATPIRFLDKCRDMTIELFNSEPIVELSLLMAIEKGILNKPKYVLSYYDIEENISQLHEKLKDCDNQEILDNVKYITNNIDKLVNIENVLKSNITNERKFIVFCSNIEHLNQMKNIVPKWFKNIGYDTKTYAVYSDKENVLTDAVIKRELESFKKASSQTNTIHLMFSVNMLNEGLHIDGVEGVMFLRKTSSPIIMMQQLGRALKVGNKAPILFDLVNNISELSFEGYFNEDYDDKKGKKKKQHDYSLLCNIEINDYTADLNSLLRNINELAAKSSWDAFKKQIIDFKERNGHCNIPSGHPLYKRCLNIRKKYERGLLEEHKYEELDELGFKWKISVYNDEHWEEMFDKLLAYIKTYGHANVPSNYKVEELATWVHTQRRYGDTMPKARKEKLLAVGFQFNLAKKMNDERWESMFEKLLEFKSIYGHVKVSSRYSDRPLSNWVRSQRRTYKDGKLSEERYSRLIGIGFDFLV